MMNPIKVLLIEQHGEMRELLTRILTAAGYQIEQLRENADPVALAIQIVPQVIVIRVRPLEVQDEEVVANLLINPRTRNIPVVAIRSLGPEGRTNAPLSNVREILIAPFSLAALRAAIARALEVPPSDTSPSQATPA